MAISARSTQSAKRARIRTAIASARRSIPLSHTPAPPNCALPPVWTSPSGKSEQSTSTLTVSPLLVEYEEAMPALASCGIRCSERTPPPTSAHMLLPTVDFCEGSVR